MQQQNKRILITAAILIPAIVVALAWPTGGSSTDAGADETTTTLTLTPTTLTSTTLEPEPETTTTLPVELRPSTLPVPPPSLAPVPPPIDDPVLESTYVEPPPAEPVAGLPPDSYWDRMAQCETGGNWQHFPYGTWTGGLGIYNQTWLGWGGGEFAPTAGQATKEQQIIVAERIAADVGYSAWGCVHTVGYP